MLARLCCFLMLGAIGAGMLGAQDKGFPGTHWESRTPEQVGLSMEKLDALQALVKGRGCVVRHGYLVYSWGDQSKSSDIASAFKPVLSTLLLMAVQEGRLNSVDEPVAEFEPRLKTINGGKDARLTWRHLASQTSGYGLIEPPGTAYAYNDFALALYYATLTQKVFGTNGTEVLRTHLAEPLQFEDAYTFNAFHRADREGRLAVSVRDLARIGFLYLHGGQWRGIQLLAPEFVQMAVNSPIPTDTPLTSGREADMLPGQHSIGGGKNITPIGPGYYSFNWWLNRTNKLGQRLFAAAPPDTYVAAGHGGKRMLWVIPSLDLIVSWNDSPIEDHDASPSDPNAKINQAAALMAAAVLDRDETNPPPKTRLGLRGERFTINDQPRFLYGISFYGALAAPENNLRADLDDMQRLGFNWLRVWANWQAFGAAASAVDDQGQPIAATMQKLKWLVAECDRRGLIVDVSISRGDGKRETSPLLTLEAHRRAVESLTMALRPWQNWYLDLSNERNVPDARFTSVADLRILRDAAKQLDPTLLITASHAEDISSAQLEQYLQTAQLDLLTPHRPRRATSPDQTATTTKQLQTWMRKISRMVPVHYQEPFRRGFGNWNPQAEDFVRDLEAALNSGAAGWCFHNGTEGGSPDGQPRRSFDLRERRLFDQLDPEERKAVEQMRTVIQANQHTNHTKLSINNGMWQINGEITYRGSQAEGLLMNVRMVNAGFEDAQRPGFDPEANADKFIARLPDYVASGVRAFTLNLQGGHPGYEGAVHSAFNPDGSLRSSCLERVRRIIQACDQHGAAVILGCFYQRQDQLLRDDEAVRAGVSNVVNWIAASGFANVALEIANEYGHRGFDHGVLKSTDGQVELIQLAKRLAPNLLVSTSDQGNGKIPDAIAAASDFILIHFNSTSVTHYSARITALKRFGKPIVCNEDDKTGARGAAAARACVAHQASWGLMLESLNQSFPFTFNGPVDDPIVYHTLRELTQP
ncbi:MAG: serine hydrolase [Verrucomicrobiae bacterium]|nr:serine hydrolase [Verrucomicrobiae bacterium]